MQLNSLQQSLSPESTLLVFLLWLLWRTIKPKHLCTNTSMLLQRTCIKIKNLNVPEWPLKFLRLQFFSATGVKSIIYIFIFANTWRKVHYFAQEIEDLVWVFYRINKWLNLPCERFISSALCCLQCLLWKICNSWYFSWMTSLSMYLTTLIILVIFKMSGKKCTKPTEICQLVISYREVFLLSLFSRVETILSIK